MGFTAAIFGTLHEWVTWADSRLPNMAKTVPSRILPR
jgi:hypothetical protein